jgi:hypothetical protein
LMVQSSRRAWRDAFMGQVPHGDAATTEAAAERYSK